MAKIGAVSFCHIQQCFSFFIYSNIKNYNFPYMLKIIPLKPLYKVSDFSLKTSDM